MPCVFRTKGSEIKSNKRKKVRRSRRQPSFMVSAVPIFTPARLFVSLGSTSVPVHFRDHPISMWSLISEDYSFLGNIGISGRFREHPHDVFIADEPFSPISSTFIDKQRVSDLGTVYRDGQPSPYISLSALTVTVLVSDSRQGLPL